MIYQQGKLIVGDDFTGFSSPFGNYISHSDNWLSGILTYDQTERNICFFPSRWPKKPKKEGKKKIKQAKPITEKKIVIPIESLFFNIDKTNFELVREGTFIKHNLVRITTENNEKYLFKSDVSSVTPYIKGSSTKQHSYWMGKQFVYNNSIIKIINYLKSK